MIEIGLSSFFNKTVLITGGAGAIGPNLTKTVAGLNAAKAIVLDGLSSAQELVEIQRMIRIGTY